MSQAPWPVSQHIPYRNGFSDFHNWHVDFCKGHVDFYRMGIWTCTNVMWIYRMGHVAFELWLGQGNPRRPVHCAGNKTKRRQKGPHENHYIVGVTPKEWAFSKKAPPSRAKGHLFWECPTPRLLHKVKCHALTQKKNLFFPRYLTGKVSSEEKMKKQCEAFLKNGMPTPVYVSFSEMSHKFLCSLM